MFKLVVGVCIVGLAAVVASPLPPADDLFTGFTPGWRDAWMEQKMAPRSNEFRLESENNNRFLRVDSQNSASALWRRVDIAAAPESTLSWRWRVETSLSHVDDERQRGGDDYAARVAVMFDGEPFARSTPFLMYVWAAEETVGDVYPSPYTDKGATIVVRSGDGESGTWLLEEHRIAADFECFFGRPALRITGIALMVDTDNTDSEATSWFDELFVRGPTSR